MKRLFFALWPSQAVRYRCFELARLISVFGEQRVRPENLHMTLIFLGNIDFEMEASIIQAADLIPPPKLSITFDQLSFWRKPRISCLTGHTNEPDLDILVNKLTEVARTHHIPVDERPFIPHITLVRKAKALRTVSFDPIIWKADTFCLIESHSRPKGVEYRIIKEWRYQSRSN